jgi:adenylylsulfate kinase
MSKDINLVTYKAVVTREKRNKLNNHKSVLVWITGLSGSGKSTLTHSLEEELYQKSYKICVLDGDNVRHGLSPDLSFKDDDRKENIRRIGEVSKLMLKILFQLLKRQEMLSCKFTAKFIT